MLAHSVAGLMQPIVVKVDGPDGVATAASAPVGEVLPDVGQCPGGIVMRLVLGVGGEPWFDSGNHRVLSRCLPKTNLRRRDALGGALLFIVGARFYRAIGACSLAEAPLSRSELRSYMSFSLYEQLLPIC